MIENLRHTSPAPENDCRRTALSDSDAEINRLECVRPKKWELRRMRSLDNINSSLLVSDYETVAGKGRCLKKKRPRDENIHVDRSQSGEEERKRWNGKGAILSVSLEWSSPNQLKHDDVVLQGSTSFINEEGSKGNEKMQDVPCDQHGSISVIGRRREMEDAVAVELGLLTRSRGSKRYDFYGVYDGHGGSQVAQACRDRLHKLLVEMVEEEDGIIDGDGVINWYKIMMESFKKMDEEVNMNGAAVATVGSTAVVAVVGEEEVVVANCGDSRAVLSRGGIAIPLSSDHKPERSDELERIELSGGKVINWNGQRVLGVLATSRSLGDHYLKPFVISDPEVTVSKRTNMDEFLILASDGLWDVISNDVACFVVRRCLDGNRRRAQQEVANGKTFNESAPPTILAREIENGGLAAEAASLLAELAIARGSRDNISVIVIQLKTSACCMAETGNCSGRKDEKA